MYVKCVPCLVGKKNDNPAYVYLCKDLLMIHELEKHLVQRAEDENVTGVIFFVILSQGIFNRIALRKIDKEQLLPLYYTRTM